MRTPLVLIAAAVVVLSAFSQVEADRDGDGMSDALEQSLLVQFVPQFMVSVRDCAGIPAEINPGDGPPTVKAENGAIYGQVFPLSDPAAQPIAEIHYYDLWARDCGADGHSLDAEHIAVLVQASGPVLATATWKARYWYAAAHEHTVCDVSQIARASTLHAETHGARVWISEGKHAGFLSPTFCKHGCGNDKCSDVARLTVPRLINLGEPGRPLNGSGWISSPLWPLAAEMAETDFPPPVVARLDRLPLTNIARFNSGRHPLQGIIAISSHVNRRLKAGAGNTVSALGAAGSSIGDLFFESCRKTAHALQTSVAHIGRFLHISGSPPLTTARNGGNN